MRGSFSFLALAVFSALSVSCNDTAPTGLKRTPVGPGAIVRFDLDHTPLPDIPLPNDAATVADPTSRTGLRLNASIVAPSTMEQVARTEFDTLEGWGTFAPITVSFDLPSKDGEPRAASDAAIDLANVQSRHQHDDENFADDAVYLVDLETGVPVPLDVGDGNFDYTIKSLGSYWPNDPRSSERNLLFDTIDETKRGAIGASTFTPALDTDSDGHMDVPNLDKPYVCDDPDPDCDRLGSPTYGSDACLAKRRLRDQCIADHLLTFYERETDTLILRPLIPMKEMTKYAVVITDRLVDANGDAVKSPFEFVYHASQETSAARVGAILDDSHLKNYFGDIAGTGLAHVAFLWSFTTQPTVDDLKKLRDGLYGKGPFASFATDYPPELEVERAIGLTAGLADGSTDESGWQTSDAGKKAGCEKAGENLYIVHVDALKPILKELLTQGFGRATGPTTEQVIENLDNLDYILIGTYKSPFLLTGGPSSVDPEAHFDLNYVTGQGTQTSGDVQFFAAVPKETAQFKQPFDVAIEGHGYMGASVTVLLDAGAMAKHGLATIGINAVGHGLDFGDVTTDIGFKGILASVCSAPLHDSLLLGRARDLDGDGRPDSGGDFWSSYIFHMRDNLRQTVVDTLQLVRIMKAFGTSQGKAVCQNAKTGWASPAVDECDFNGDGKADLFGDFDGNGVPDFGGPNARYHTWGESLGGVLAGIHGALDPSITSSVPISGGGGLTDLGLRSMQSGVLEAVLLRVWGPLLVTVPGGARPTCTSSSVDSDHCTVCDTDQISLRWVMPEANHTGELEIRCFDKSEIQGTTVLMNNLDNHELRCARVDDSFAMRIGVPASIGDKISLSFFDGLDQVTDYKTCKPTFDENTKARTIVSKYGKGGILKGGANALGTATCQASSCVAFEGQMFGDGDPLVAVAEGLGQARQTPEFRQFMQLAQTAVEPADPISFAPFYALQTMTDPDGKPIPPRALFIINSIGDTNVPLNSGIAFARAAGALPFLRPEQKDLYPDYADYVTPDDLYAALGNKTPNRTVIGDHVGEGVSSLARTPAGSACAASANQRSVGSTFVASDGSIQQCLPNGCTDATESDSSTRVCYDGTHCDTTAGQCVADPLGQVTCDEALFDVDDIDEGGELYSEMNSAVPLRLARYSEPVSGSASLSSVWEPRLTGAPHTEDGGWTPSGPVDALLDAYIVPEGIHGFPDPSPCAHFDSGSYFNNLVGRFFMSGGTDVYYLSHPSSHHCLGTQDVASCGYLKKP